MKNITKLSLNKYKYTMDFKPKYIEVIKLDLLTLLYLTSINVIEQGIEQNKKLIKRVERLFLYINILVEYKDARSVEDKNEFKEAIFDELNELRDLYLDFDIEEINISDFHEWLEEQE